MAQDATRADFSVAQKVIHWLMALMIMADLVIAQKFGDVMTDADRFESRSDHATMGTIVAVLFVIRLYLRWKNGAPALPAEMADWQKLLAHVAHWALYILIGWLIVSGILTAMNANSVVAPFGLFAFGDGIGNLESFGFFRWFHDFATKAIIALIALHIVAALYHVIIVRDGVTGRMLTFWKSEKAA